MRVALYLRKSTDEQADSLDTQRASATAFATAKGWTVAAEFSDSGISRAEFAREKRPGVWAMLDAAKRREFDAVLLRDLSRLGGDVFRTGMLVTDLHAAGVRLFVYATGDEITAANAMQCMTLAFQLYGSHDEREKVSTRTREALERKAREGKIAGGRCYGYGNKPSGQMKQTKHGLVPAWHDYEIEPAQAEVVREIFGRFASGEGLLAIAKSLNQRHVASPTGRGWAKSGLHAMLRNERYLGRLLWGGRKKKYVGGTKKRVVTSESERVSVDAPHLRIIDDDLWALVQVRHEANRRATHKASGRQGGRPSVGLLAPFMRCAHCGGGYHVRRTKKSHTIVEAYGCTNYHLGRGGRATYNAETKQVVKRASCTNSLTRPVDDVNAAVLGWVTDHLLREDIVAAAMRELRDRVEADSKADTTDVPKLRAEVSRLEKEISRLNSQLAHFDDDVAEDVRKAITERSRRKRELEHQLAARRGRGEGMREELARMEAAAAQRMTNLRAVIAAGDPDSVRLLLRAVFGRRGILAEPIAVDDLGGSGRPVRRLELTASALAAGVMVEGVAPLPKTGGVPRGPKTPGGAQILALRTLSADAPSAGRMDEVA